MSQNAEAHLMALKEFFSRDVAVRGTAPMKESISIAVRVGDDAYGVSKLKGKIVVEMGAPESPDLTFWVPEPSLKTLTSMDTEEIGDIGVQIIKLMAEADPAHHISAKVHISLLTLFMKGYLGVIPLGGATVMKFLGSKGLTSMGKIKDAVSKFKE